MLQLPTALALPSITARRQGGGVRTTPLWPNTIASTSYNYIHAGDPDAFASVVYLGFLSRSLPGGSVNCHVFRASFTDTAKTIEMRMAANPLDGSSYADEAAARVDVDRYTPRLGKLPLVYRRNIDHMIGYSGDGVDHGDEDMTSEDAGHFFIIYSDRATTRIANNDLEETFFHEATHASIQQHGATDALTLDDYDYLASPEWAAAKAADNDRAVTTYAQSADQERLAEHGLLGFTMELHPERLEPERAIIAAMIPNQLAFFRKIFFPRFLLADGTSRLLLADGTTPLRKTLP